MQHYASNIRLEAEVERNETVATDEARRVASSSHRFLVTSSISSSHSIIISSLGQTDK